jgi:glycosyltransferase involved in cell wall biosynthesis
MKQVVSITPIAVERDSRTFKQAASMARLGYRSTVVEAEPSRSLSGALPFELVSIGVEAPATPAVLEEGTAPTPRGPEWLRRALASPLGFADYVRNYVQRCRLMAAALPAADLYYLHSPLLYPALRWRDRRAHTPFVYDAHDLYWELRRDGRELPAATRAIWAIWDRVERACVARANRCVTVGTGVARLSEERFGRPFAVVRNAHDRRLDEDRVTDLRVHLGLRETDFVLAVSGNFKRGLAVEPMLEALAQLPDRAHVAFVGANYAPFAATAERLGVGARAHFVPAVAPTRIVPLLEGADAAAVPYFASSTTVRHALPNGLFHAVAAGLPVLYSSSLVDLRTLATELNLGWEIDPTRADSITAAVRYLLDDSAELARARSHVTGVRDELSWAHEEPELERVVASALDCHTRSA